MLLIDRFIASLQSTTNRILSKVDDPIVRGGMIAVREAARLCDKVIFAESTMRMLIDKIERYDETVQEVMALLGESDTAQAHVHATARLQRSLPAFRGAWVEFHKPIDTIAAILVFVPSVYLSTGKDRQQLYLIDTHAEIVEIMEAEPGEAWSYASPFHQCRLCRREAGVLVPCKACMDRLIAWSEIMALCAIIAGQYLAAMRYEEKTLTGMRREPREKSKKERRIPTKHIFKVIDANEIIIPVAQEEESTHKEPRGSWMTGDEIYEEIRTRPFTRTYRHSRYVNVRGQTVNFPDGIKRLQPKRPELIGKHVTRVKASSYEHEES